MSHFQKLFVLCSVHNKVSLHVSSHYWEVWFVFQAFQMTSPVLIDVCYCRQVFIQLVRLFRLTRHLVDFESACLIGYYETILGSRHNLLYAKNRAGRCRQDHFEVTCHISQENITLRRTHDQLTIDPAMTCIMSGDQVVIFLYQPIMHKSQSHIPMQLHVSVNIPACNEHNPWIVRIERHLSGHLLTLSLYDEIGHKSLLIPKPNLKSELAISASVCQGHQILLQLVVITGREGNISVVGCFSFRSCQEPFTFECHEVVDDTNGLVMAFTHCQVTLIWRQLHS